MTTRHVSNATGHFVDRLDRNIDNTFLRNSLLGQLHDRAIPMVLNQGKNYCVIALRAIHCREGPRGEGQNHGFDIAMTMMKSRIRSAARTLSANQQHDVNRRKSVAERGFQQFV